ncbi:MAG: glutathione transferase GstA [Candidatus Muproteobacteria bacterium RIFCSPHIGHO2_12_FULL_60_33]|uniref:Glutathione transferase GstA n=1 Tax=Candidatus Muproteobacteria bacterium RIFCSPLOWO2_01_FULL_60_18 TaxID=1817768 RepID=A0A1F6U650_9PROT|nr:MAG: glutathione transferase GstA [Candidatus Muproteobacteria bacterium RIFCSPHIGHO2_01_60_12]OGI52789.1 MAG: glutathione transferase GstA [Candidatus Muproteobacteria bacterium RIFCSPLOWO2_01_FULL_60_18]OGI54931.1 MAG: glutathione transferase GstA [Candidatus Muproteobacteria bacterium RIFCSPHIGHO2_02_FULL_60_13]OGI55691.1 MAG: glutathione transferase GstA [Candidatus Muproteobacteria bacterium RIFCSPHIGHO2_12_FULL_60_33]OGI58956.1 MAG: glutathione transferase GstA [Candidatus Muproteobact
MKLYYAPGACSMAVHIVLRETGQKFDMVKVDLRQHQTASGEDFYKINPKGYVPALRLDDGQVLTENAVILQYVADQKPESGLAPRAGTMERYRLMEWLNFISSEVHKTLGALFNPKITPEWKEDRIALFGRRCDYLVQALGGKPYLMGDRYTIADAYLFTILGWAIYFKLDMSQWPALKEYADRIAARPAVKEAMRAEGLIK